MIGLPIEFEHICAPPSPILLSDAVYMRNFRPRAENSEIYSVLDQVFRKLTEASLILLDDASEFHFPLTQTYPALAHRMERSNSADLIAYRWQRYVENHHKLPITPVEGRNFPLEGRDRSIEALSSLLDTPIFRIATIKTLAQFTENWEYKHRPSTSGGPRLRPLKTDRFLTTLANWVKNQLDCLETYELSSVQKLNMDDLPHFCSHFTNRSKLARVLDAFDRFCIAGRPSSVPFISKYLQEKGKHFSYVPSCSASSLSGAEPYECLLICGPTGVFEEQGPAVAVMATSKGLKTKNLPAGHELTDIRLRTHAEASDEDDSWYNIFGGPADNSSSSVNAIRGAVRKARQEGQRLREARSAASSS